MMSKKELVLLWYKAQRGHINECKKAHLEFSEEMWKLYASVASFKDIEE